MNRQKDEKGKLFIGRLSWETESDTLLNYFSRYGEVIDCVVVKNKDTGCSRRFGFVTYKDPECVHLILSGGPHIIDGRQVDPKACNPRTPYKMSESKSHPSPTESESRKIFVGGLPFDVDEGILIDFFSRYGKVKEASIMYDLQKGRSRGFGFLTFDNEDSVDEVCKEHFVTINGKQVECKRAEPLSRNKLSPNNESFSSGPAGASDSLMMPPRPPSMLHQMQHPPPSLDHKAGVAAPPLPGMEFWKPPPDCSSNNESRKELKSENGYNAITNGDGVRQPYAANGATPSIYQPVSYPGIYSLAQQQQMRQQQQQTTLPVQQLSAAANQSYPLPMYPNFSSPPPSAQQPPHDYMPLWNQPTPVENPVPSPVERSQWAGVPPPSLVASQPPPTHQQQPQPPHALTQQQQQPNSSSSFNLANQIASAPSAALPTVYPGLSPLNQLKISPNFLSSPVQAQVQQAPLSAMPYSNFGYADSENPNFAAGPGTSSSSTGNGHMMMVSQSEAANNQAPGGQSFNQRQQPVTQTYHPYRR